MKTDNDKLANVSQNAVANYLVLPFKAENGHLIMVRQLTTGKVTYRDCNHRKGNVPTDCSDMFCFTLSHSVTFIRGSEC